MQGRISQSVQKVHGLPHIAVVVQVLVVFVVVLVGKLCVDTTQHSVDISEEVGVNVVQGNRYQRGLGE